MNNDKLKIANCAKDLIYFVEEILVNYPKKSYVLKDKIENTSYEVLELVYFTNTLEDNRLVYQKQILSKIAMLDFYFEKSYKNKYINLRNLKKGAKLITIIRKLVYGWIKSGWK